MCQELENALGSGAVQKALFSPHGAHYLSASTFGNNAGQRSSSAQRQTPQPPSSTWSSSGWPQTEATLQLVDYDEGGFEAFFGQEHSLRDDPPSTDALSRMDFAKLHELTGYMHDARDVKGHAGVGGTSASNGRG